MSGETVSDEKSREQRFAGWKYLTEEGNSFRGQLIKAGATQKDIDDITEALGEWKDITDGWQAWLSSENIWRK